MLENSDSPPQTKLNSNANSKEWTPDSWKSHPIKQQPKYADEEAVKRAIEKVQRLPPLIHAKEILTLRNHLAKAARGEAFILQGGDCAERFVDCSKAPIENKFKILLQMSLIILWGSRIPVVRIGRMAGQFAKPRTSPYETINGKQVFSFKGDNINEFDVERRDPNPDRMVQAYFHSAATLNYIRAMISGGVADLHNPRAWMLTHVQDEKVREEYEILIDQITDGLDFLQSIHASDDDALRSVEFYTSHEGLLLDYEAALTEKYKERYFNLGAHFLWIGDRTRDPEGAHIEYFRGISNPIGVKIGPSTKPEDLAQLLPILNPNREEGRLTLITRYGASQVENLLPQHIAAVKATGVPVLWICDPCHGNTETAESGFKTRHVAKMTAELLATFDIHAREGSRLGGVHLEMTGDNVTECIGGSAALNATHLSENYETFCDPRLNYTQSLDMAFTIGKKLKEKNRKLRVRSNS